MTITTTRRYNFVMNWNSRNITITGKNVDRSILSSNMATAFGLVGPVGGLFGALPKQKTFIDRFAESLIEEDADSLDKAFLDAVKQNPPER